jgi:hypothetical protein
MFDLDFGHLSEFSTETDSVPALSASGSRSSIEMELDVGPSTPVTTSEVADKEILYAVDAFHVGNVGFLVYCSSYDLIESRFVVVSTHASW